MTALTENTAPMTDLPETPPILTVTSLGKRYGHRWALRDCSLDLPAAKIIALVGPNGAGKTTLLKMMVGLSQPTQGSLMVAGHSPQREPTFVLPRVGFVAQEHPLYSGFSVADLLTMGRKLNRRWNQSLAVEYLDQLGIPLQQKAGKLSGGQQSQVALTLALAKEPDLLLLDEPLASLDPLARRDFLSMLMDAVAARPHTVLLSSHIIGDLERVCDYLVVLGAGQLQLADEIDCIKASHAMLTLPRDQVASVARQAEVIFERRSQQDSALVVRRPYSGFPAQWEARSVTLEEVVLAYLERARSQPDLKEVAR
jgi:ABC-2 type transport system ATP-binding protein